MAGPFAGKNKAQFCGSYQRRQKAHREDQRPEQLCRKRRRFSEPQRRCLRLRLAACHEFCPLRKVQFPAPALETESRQH